MTPFDWATVEGCLLLFKVSGQEVGIETIHGASGAIRADVTVLDGDREGGVYTDTLVLPKLLQSQLRPRIGARVLGRLGRSAYPKPGQAAPWTLMAATEADKAAGREWLDRHRDQM